ncbi:MAG: peptide chain release factor N(5)-glutamine methyltransferase [Robiginitalea sp.]|nr:peptide chain release factor N(5)-glutamine methyltransferase [Robiginitalea sp.]
MKEYLLRDIRQRFREGLEDTYPAEEISNIFHLLTSHYFGFPRTLLALEPQKTLEAEEAALLLEALGKLSANIPVQYITGKAFFMELELQVSPAVLIPRPETEELVRWMLGSHLPAPAPTILDIGTGSGCIALGLKKNWKKATVMALDLSARALEVARNNARKLQLEVLFRQGDIRAPGSQWPVFDILVSNPPYVPAGDRESMQPHVAESEPAEALFVPDEAPLGIYMDLLGFASRHLKPGGWIYLEIYEAFGEAISALLRGAGYSNIEVKKDIFGKDRFVRGQGPARPFREDAAGANQNERP